MSLLFPLMRTDVSGIKNLGMGPLKQFQQLPVVRWLITGTTKDLVGAVLPNCTVDLFVTTTDLLVGVTQSDAVGAFSFSVGLSQQYYAVAYLAGAPDVAGTTVNTLVGVEG